jgi:hypothetical protein
MKTLAEEWSGFEAAVMPASAGPVQRHEMRGAFYAGFHSALTAAVEAAIECGDDDARGAELLEQLRQEARRFVLSMLRGES